MTSETDIPTLVLRDVRRRFDRAAATFDGSDFVHRETRDGLLARLEPIRIDPRVIVDLGAATGTGSRLLARRFRRAQVIGVDISLPMLVQARGKRGWFSRTGTVQALAEALPFADASVDIVFANLLLPWVTDPAATFAEAARVLRDGGLFLFATLGPDSLAELRDAWEGVDTGPHVNPFPDMHDLGDAAVRAGLADPVLDVDYLNVTYRNAAQLFADLTATGARNSLRGRRRSLGGRRVFAAMRAALDARRVDGLLTLQLELVYGHCWGTGRRPGSNEFRFSAEQIGGRRR